MKQYEVLIICPTQLSGDPTRSGKSIFEDLIKKYEGKIVSCTELGKRLLGYAVKRQKEGNFISFVFELDPAKVDALKRALQLAEEIIKFTIIIWKKPTPIVPRPVTKRPPVGQTVHAHAGERR